MTLFGFLVIAAILVEGEAIGATFGKRLPQEKLPIISADFEVDWRGVIMSFNAEKNYTLRIDQLELFYHKDYAGRRMFEGGVGESFVKIGFALVPEMPRPRVATGVDIYGEITEGSKPFNNKDYKWRYWITENPDKYYAPYEKPDEINLKKKMKEDVE